MKRKPSVMPVYSFLTLSCLLIYFVFIGSPSAVFAEEGGVVQGHSHEDIKRGERFFKGLLPFNRQGPSCVSCHNLTPSDTLNWNPSAYDIAVKYMDQDEASFQATLMQPMGVKMAQVHSGFQYKEEDLKSMKAYLDDLAMTGPSSVKPTIYNLLIFIFLGILITWAILELIFFRKVKFRIIPFIVFLAAFGIQVRMVIREGTHLGLSPGYAPVQPIKFSHKVHAGDNGIDCMYCHHTAEQSKSAGIPAMNLCMNCHVLIREGSYSGKFEIAKVVDAVEKKEPVEWGRLHKLPDHVFFSHAIHVGSAKLDCAQCHGPVEEMDIMRQHSDLSMGWCINCHRETEVQFKDNGYYETFVKLHEKYDTEDLKRITAEDVGANDCMRCHY
jgi:cytochrome c553